MVGSGPFRLSRARRAARRTASRPTRTTGRARPTSTSRLPRLQERGPGRPGPDQGRVDFVEDISALQVKSLQGRRSPPTTATRRASRRSPSTPGRSTSRPAEPIGDPNPAVLDPAFRSRWASRIDRDKIIRRSTRARGSPAARSSRRPTSTTTGSRRRGRVPYDPDRAAELLDEAGYTVGADGFGPCPTGRRSAPCGWPRAPTRRRPSARHELLPGVAGRRRHRLRGRDLRVEQAHRHHPRGQLRAPSSGAGTSSRTRTRCSSYMTCGQLGNWSDSWYCNKEYDALYEQQHAELDEATRGAGQADAGDPLRGRAVPGDGVQLDRRGVPQRPVRLLPAAARPGRHLADPVRRPQLPERAPGRRRGA